MANTMQFRLVRFPLATGRLAVENDLHSGQGIDRVQDPDQAVVQVVLDIEPFLGFVQGGDHGGGHAQKLVGPIVGPDAV